jgi:hypothetical protein
MGYVITFSFLLFLVMIGLYVAFNWLSYSNLPPEQRGRFVSEKLEKIGRDIWDFGKPILHAALVLAIALSLLSFFNLDMKSLTATIQWDIRSVLAFLVVGSFCLSAIAGSSYTGFLKDVTLVVLGFYFGSYIKP